MPDAFALDIESIQDDARTPDQMAQMCPDQEAGIAFLAEQVSQ